MIIEPMEERRRYYTKEIDWEWLTQEATPQQAKLGVQGQLNYGNQLEDPDEVGKEPNLVSSLLEDGWHAPCLDIDIPMFVIPSTTPGKQHVYFPTVRLTWQQYDKLLWALTVAGILENGYYNASAKRQMTCLRLPGVRKYSKEEIDEARRAYQEATAAPLMKKVDPELEALLDEEEIIFEKAMINKLHQA